MSLAVTCMYLLLPVFPIESFMYFLKTGNKCDTLSFLTSTLKLSMCVCQYKIAQGGGKQTGTVSHSCLPLRKRQLALVCVKLVTY